MSSATPDSGDPSRRPPLRVWPGVVIVALQWLCRYGFPAVVPETLRVGVMAGLAGGLGVGLWWLFFSRARWFDRVGALVVLAIAFVATSRVVHPSIANGMMGMMLPVYAIPIVSLAFVAAVVIARRRSGGYQRGLIVAAVVLAFGGFALVRSGGINSEADADFQWRWAATPEDQLLAQDVEKPKPGQTPAAAAKDHGVWPGFRGARRDSVIRGVQIETNWSASPPLQLWRRSVGPGWSSFAVGGDLVYTQEQRGEEEVVACYSLATGEPVWRHQDAARFWESNAGAGPRGTPAIQGDRVYSLGATGIVNVLDARTGSVVWSRDAAGDAKQKVPDWGFASSPLVLGDLVVVAVGGTLVAYEIATGVPRWFGPKDGKSYSSPHLLEIERVMQILLVSGAGVTSVAPVDGKVLWQHAWPGFAIVQPAQIAPGELLISTGDRVGARRIAVTNSAGGWTVTERWTSNRLKPYFNDFVLHRDHAFGFDNGILACVDLADGKGKWKGGRYGRGQVVLLADQDALLVLSEQGELALVAAAPEQFTELARFPALEGKTWNHPVLVGDVLLVRNDREMAAFRLTLKRG